MKRNFKRQRLQSTSVLAAICCLVTIFGLPQAGFSQQAATSSAAFTPAPLSSLMPGTTAAHPSSTAEEEESSTSHKHGGDGVRVHGHWVLQVKNPDGKLGERREFENSLVVGSTYRLAPGDQMLVELLSGIGAAGAWAVGFVNGPTTTAGIDVSTFCSNGIYGDPSPPAGISCYASATGPSCCLPISIVQPQYGMSVTASFGATSSVILSGNFTVPAQLGGLGQINAVQSLLSMCNDDVTTQGNYRVYGTFAGYQSNYNSKSCEAGTSTGYLESWNPFTSTNITNSAGVLSPLPVSTNQIITFTVTLSFS